jgi:ribosome-interacting GTPase 1
MPTNVPPEYHAIEKRHKAATTIEGKISTLEEMIAICPKHKGTDKLRAGMRKKLSRLKDAGQAAKKSQNKQKSLFNINKEGAGQVILIGASNTGKSSILDSFSNADPKIDVFPQTTWEPMPGMMEFEDIQIQLIDTPPLTDEYIDPEFFNLVFRCDIILIVIDIQAHPEKQFRKTLNILKDHNIYPQHQQERCNDDKTITFKPIQILINKCDDPDCDEIVELFKILLEEEWPILTISVKNSINLDKFRRNIFESLKVIRVYAKSPGKKADLKLPFLLKKGQTVEDFAKKVHKDFAAQLKTARAWGTGVYDGQPVHRDHQLHDMDIVELHIK